MNKTQDPWQIIELKNLIQSRPAQDVSFQELLQVQSMHCGLYYLKKGSQDMQSPHDEDEIYYVIEGQAKIKVGDQERSVTPGTLLYIKAAEEHSFFEIEEDMTLLVIFA